MSGGTGVPDTGIYIYLLSFVGSISFALEVLDICILLYNIFYGQVVVKCSKAYLLLSDGLMC